MEYGGSHEIEFKTGVCNVTSGKADRPVAAFKGVYNEEDDIWTMSGEGAKADPVEPESSVPEEKRELRAVRRRLDPGDGSRQLPDHRGGAAGGGDAARSSFRRGAGLGEDTDETVR